jgi:hypothetical protein
MGKLANIPGANLVAKINSAHRQAFGNAKKAMEYAAECGRLLLEAKELVEHGEWLPWLEANTEVGERQSQRYMRLAQNWESIEGKNDGASYLDIEAALKLIAKPTAKPKTDDDEPKPEAEDEPVEPSGAPGPTEPDGDEPESDEPNPKPEPDVEIEGDEPGAEPDEDDDPGGYQDGELEYDWGRASPEMRQGFVRHIVKESDPVSLALTLVETMDAQQVERLLAGAEQHKMNLGRKRA